MEKFKSIICFLGIILFFIVFPVFGQQTGFEAKDLQRKFYQSRKFSDELVRSYTWESRTDVTKDGKVMDILIENVRYGSDGKLHWKVINDQEAKLPSSFLIHQIAEDMKTKMVSFMNRLRLFLEEYALTDQEKGALFFSKAMIGNPDPEGQILVSANDVIVKGDRLQWWIDSRNFSITKTSISTTFEGDQIEFTATYKYIDPGLNYMAFADIMVPAKSTVVLLHCYDYMKLN